MWWILLACEPAPEPILDLEERAASRLRSRMADHVVEVSGPGTLALTSPDGHEHEVFLTSVSDTCAATPDRCETALTAWVDRNGRNTQARAEPLRLDQLRPMVFPKQQAVDLGLDHEPLAGDLVIVLAMDAERSSRIVDTDELTALAVTLEQARDMARVQFAGQEQPRRETDRLLQDVWTPGQIVLAVQPDELLVGTLEQAQAAIVDGGMSKTPLVRDEMTWRAAR